LVNFFYGRARQIAQPPQLPVACFFKRCYLFSACQVEYPPPLICFIGIVLGFSIPLLPSPVISRPGPHSPCRAYVVFSFVPRSPHWFSPVPVGRTFFSPFSLTPLLENLHEEDRMKIGSQILPLSLCFFADSPHSSLTVLCPLIALLDIVVFPPPHELPVALLLRLVCL